MVCVPALGLGVYSLGVAQVEKVNASSFEWGARKLRLVQTIAKLDTDILSIVECDHYATFFQGQVKPRLCHKCLCVRR